MLTNSWHNSYVYLIFTIFLYEALRYKVQIYNLMNTHNKPQLVTVIIMSVLLRHEVVLTVYKGNKQVVKLEFHSMY